MTRTIELTSDEVVAVNTAIFLAIGHFENQHPAIVRALQGVADKIFFAGLDGTGKEKT